MNLKYKIAALSIACFFSLQVHAQSRPNIKQPPKINGILKATTNANVAAKIHANSNSVFGTGNTHPNYNKKNKVQKSDAKNSDIKNEAEVKKNNKSKKKK